MKIRILETAPQETSAQVLIAGLFEGDKPVQGGIGRLDASLGNRIETAITHGDFESKQGDTLVLYGGLNRGPRHIVIVGLGKRTEFNGEKIRRAFGAAGKYAREHKHSDVVVLPPLKGLEFVDEIRATVAALEGVAFGMYRYVRHTKDLESKPVLKELGALPGEDEGLEGLREGIRQAEATITGTLFARDLVAMPAMDLYPESYARMAMELSGDHVKVEILDEARLDELGMGALLAVGRGSFNRPVMIHLSYDPGDLPDDAKTFVLVGKGITFDSGGLNIKTTPGIRDMKTDMAGSASVMGVFKALESWAPRCRVEGFIPAAENKTGDEAYRPGDVLTSYKGLTIEVDNTDAEGRLALCDALAYAVEIIKPDAIIDIATLTGACVVALGHHASGLFSTNDSLAGILESAGNETGERVWRFPLWEEYSQQIKSEIADLKNTGGSPGGAITAAAFLREFVDSVPWAHIDIAGTANDVSLNYVPHKELPTGVGVRLILEALKKWA